MCGIAGIAVFNGKSQPSYESLKAMCDTIRHRGPDDEGLDIRDGVALGMRRLSIIDLQGGQQPIFNEDRTVRTVFNGEIYNFKELRAELKKCGHVFRTNSDTEVIVHAYEEYGDGFPDHLNGMFAIALHDSRNQKLILARDHIGIKPLFYACGQFFIVWGSEIKALLASRMVARELDLDALGEYLAWEYVPGDSTLFRSIRKLEPAHLIVIDLNRPDCRPRSYWDVPAVREDSERTLNEWLEIVNQQIVKSVRSQLVSDVPLGAFLSGGVDSSLVVAAMGAASTYSIGFDDPSYNELKWARKVADHLNVEHVENIIKPDVADLFDRLMAYMDDPIGDFSIFPTYLVSRYARNHVTVALSGDGGDELFGGYETYLAQLVARRYAALPNLVRKKLIEPVIGSMKPRPGKKGLINKVIRFIEGMQQDGELCHARWRKFMGDSLIFTDDAQAMITRPTDSHILDLFQRAGEREPINRCLYVDLKSYLCDNCLVKIDRMSMAVSLEARVPLLDKNLVEIAFQIPDVLKVGNGKTKILLKQIAASRVPVDCVYRPKEGFSIPIKNWLKTRLRPVMENYLNHKRIEQEGIFRPGIIEQLKQAHLAGTANHSHVLWTLVVFQDWQERWLKET